MRYERRTCEYSAQDYLSGRTLLFLFRWLPDEIYGQSAKVSEQRRRTLTVGDYLGRDLHLSDASADTPKWSGQLPNLRDGA
jgi:hypothetical protein